MELKTVKVDDIVTPSRSEKLHPEEGEDFGDGVDLETLRERSENGEDLTEWEEFRLSVGTEPNKPVEISSEDGQLVLIDGDRRVRALTQNNAEEVRAFIRMEGEDIEGESDRLIKMIQANEFRKPSDKLQRARHMAQLTAPWLLPPSERNTNEQEKTQSEIAGDVGKTQASVSIWLGPIKSKHKLRTALASKSSGLNPTPEETEKIDEIEDLLKRGGESNNIVVTVHQEQLAASELEDMEGVSLNELHTAAERAVEKNWNTNRFLQFVQDEFAYDEMMEDESEIESGIMGDSSGDPFENDSGLDDVDGVEVNDEEEDHIEADFGFDDPEVEWENVLDKSDLPGDVSFSELMQEKMQYQTIEDDASITISAMASMTGLSKRDVIKRFVEPLIVEAGISWMREQQQEEIEQPAD